VPQNTSVTGSKDQLAVSPQCGFVSAEEGNILTEEEQWAKLEARGRRGAGGEGRCAKRHALSLKLF